MIESRGYELAGWRMDYACSCFIDLFFHFKNLSQQFLNHQTFMCIEVIWQGSLFSVSTLVGICTENNVGISPQTCKSSVVPERDLWLQISAALVLDLPFIFCVNLTHLKRGGLFQQSLASPEPDTWTPEWLPSHPTSHCSFLKLL